jgi:hypothetical protein
MSGGSVTVPLARTMSRIVGDAGIAGGNQLFKDGDLRRGSEG